MKNIHEVLLCDKKIWSEKHTRILIIQSMKCLDIYISYSWRKTRYIWCYLITTYVTFQHHIHVLYTYIFFPHVILHDISTEISEVNKTQFSVLITKFIASSVNTVPWSNAFYVFSAISTIIFQNHCLVTGWCQPDREQAESKCVREGGNDATRHAHRQ
jgi:hypothetical protein